MKIYKKLTKRNWITVICFLCTLLLFNFNSFSQSGYSITGTSTCISFDNNGGSSTYSYTIFPTTGISNVQWSTKGDIDIVGSATGTGVSIKSNPAEPSRLYGYGKGRLTVSFTVDTIPMVCGPQSVSLDIYKIFHTNNNIVGPECISQNDTVTYSINSLVSVNLDQEIGIDSYKWILPSGWSSNILYYSGDSSSVTFKAGMVTGTDSLIVGIGRCNISTSDYTDTLILGKKLHVSLDYPTCVSTSVDQITVKTIGLPTGSYTYSWSKPSNWKTIYSSADSIVLSIDDNPGKVVFTITNSCESVDVEADITRTLGSNSVISGDTCVSANSVQTFTVTNAPINTDLKWTIPSGNDWYFANSDTTAQSVQIHVGTVPGTISVTGMLCDSIVRFAHVSIKPENPVRLTGDTLIARCSTDSLTYKVNSVAYASGYGWIFPAGWVPSTATTYDTTITVQPHGATNGQVKVFALGCSHSDTLVLDVNYASLDAPDAIDISRTCLNVGDNVTDTLTLSIHTPQSGIGYHWALPSGWIISSANADSSVVHVTTNGTAGNFSISARAKDNCGVSSYTTTSLNVSALTFSVATTTFTGFTVFAVNPNPVSGADYYTWYSNSNTPISGGAGATKVNIVVFDPIDYPICVAVRNSSTGCTTKHCATEAMMRTASRTDMERTAVNYETINAYPNPTNNILNVEFTDEASRQLRIVDGTGQLALETTAEGTKTSIDVSSLPTGSYILVVTSSKGVASERITITK